VAQLEEAVARGEGDLERKKMRRVSVKAKGGPWAPVLTIYSLMSH